ncbi:DNA-binding LacI/PurR family transcriptional regulator [Streptacidiphilus sp. MAP12-20]
MKRGTTDDGPGPSASPPAAPHPGGATLDDVAALAGVARSTASRAINGSHEVSEKARAAVQRAVAELGYVPNHAARALVTSRTDAIALIVPETETRLFSEPYFSDVISGVSMEVAAADMQLLLILVRNEGERRRLTAYLRSHRVDGVILVSVHRDDPLPTLLEELGIPTVLAGRRGENESLSYVAGDNHGGARTAVQHLIGAGRTRIATIAGPLDMEVARTRLAGYRDALVRAGQAPTDDLVQVSDFTEEGGRTAMHALLQRSPDVDAVFCASDVMAAGALQALRSAERRVPEDVALVGFDDSIIARHTTPALTSVRQPVEEIGRAIARLLLDQVAEPKRPRRQLILPTELVVRQSAPGHGTSAAKS